jgi:RNA polymerase sigma-70 factor (ECF subfamily)
LLKDAIKTKRIEKVTCFVKKILHVVEWLIKIDNLAHCPNLFIGMQSDRYQEKKDEELISIMLSDNDFSLFKILFNRYHGKVQSKCMIMLKDKQLSRESAQYILEKAYEKLGTFKGTASFSSWLYSITYNYCIDYLRNKNKIHYPEWNKEHEIPEIIDETDDEDSELNYQRLSTILDEIHPEEKALLLMKFNDDLSILQIANALRISESAAKMRIKRAKARVLFLYKKKYSN